MQALTTLSTLEASSNRRPGPRPKLAGHLGDLARHQEDLTDALGPLSALLQACGTILNPTNGQIIPIFS
jgi:hypothetical protein